MTGPFVVITSKAHLPRMHAHRILLENEYDNWCIVVDNALQRVHLIENTEIPRNKIIMADTPEGLGQDGIAWVRGCIERNIVAPGQWYVSLDDNVRGWTRLPDPFYQQDRIDFDLDDPPADITWRQAFEQPATFQQVIDGWQELITKCELHSTEAGGFATETNFFFRGIKWQKLGYVRAQNAVWKNTGRPFYYGKGMMLEDFARTVEVVANRGQVCINRFMKPQKQFFEAGGIGTFEQRRPNLVYCCDRLLEQYPGLLRRNKGQDYSLTFVPKSPEGVMRWREKYGIV